MSVHVVPRGVQSLIWIFVAFDYMMISIICLTADEIEAEKSGWSVDPNTQYHIQTDEGPERYFRYQTLNGQYRKEKRLEDGTVVGTEGWLDPLGYLRIKDYVADDQGYRILRSKMVYVGKDRPIQEAVSAAKKVPAQSGILATPQRPPNPFRQPELKDLSSNSIESNTPSPHLTTIPIPSPSTDPALTYPSTIQPTPDPYPRTLPPPLYEDGYSQPNTNYLLPGYQFQSPYVSPYRSPYPYHLPPPSVLMQPPTYDEANAQASQAHPVQVQLPPGVSYQTQQPYPQTQQPYHQTQQPYHQTQQPYYQTHPNALGAGNLTRSNEGQGRVAASPVNTQGSEYPAYDGTHTVANGFQYYLKTHYHEEEEQPQDKKVGSFGYVDPFGIRRVVYYSADPEHGFIHKKNNRYVGFNASPYDPLPPRSS